MQKRKKRKCELRSIIDYPIASFFEVYPGLVKFIGTILLKYYRLTDRVRVCDLTSQRVSRVCDLTEERDTSPDRDSTDGSSDHTSLDYSDRHW